MSIERGSREIFILDRTLWARIFQEDWINIFVSEGAGYIGLYPADGEKVQQELAELWRSSDMVKDSREFSMKLADWEHSLF